MRPGYGRRAGKETRSREKVGGFRRTRYRGLDRTGLAGYLVGTAYNLVRMVKLLQAPTARAVAAAA